MWKNHLMCYIGSELWESKFDGLLALVKEYKLLQMFGKYENIII